MEIERKVREHKHDYLPPLMDRTRAAEALGVCRQTLRAWELRGVFAPAANPSGGRPYYTREQIERAMRGDFGEAEA